MSPTHGCEGSDSQGCVTKRSPVFTAFNCPHASSRRSETASTLQARHYSSERRPTQQGPEGEGGSKEDQPALCCQRDAVHQPLHSRGLGLVSDWTCRQNWYVLLSPLFTSLSLSMSKSLYLSSVLNPSASLSLPRLSDSLSLCLSDSLPL